MEQLGCRSVTEFEMGFQKLPPKIVNYQDYKSFDTEGFKNTIFCILNKHFHYKRKYLRANKVPFMIKELRKAMMKRPKLRNKFFKSKTFSDRKAYTSQRNFSLTGKQYVITQFFSDGKAYTSQHNFSLTGKYMRHNAIFLKGYQEKTKELRHNAIFLKGYQEKTKEFILIITVELVRVNSQLLYLQTT